MNDLNGLDWSSKPATGQKPAQGQGNYSAFSTLKPTPPTSGRASPLAGNLPLKVPTKSPAHANDSFATLVSFAGSNPNRNLSLQEQQKLREQSKLQQLVDQKTQLQNQWAGNDDVWNSLGSGRNTPVVKNGHGTSAPIQSVEAEDDLFAAFNKPTVKESKSVPRSAPSIQPDAEDDDPFELSKLQAKQGVLSQPVDSSLTDDDDILGDLGRPVLERKSTTRKSPPRRAPLPRVPSPESFQPSDHPQDRAVAELVDMGFPADKAKRALESTDSGLNVQAAVGILLNRAHDEARQKSRSRDPGQSQIQDERPTRRARPCPTEGEDGLVNSSQRDRSSTPSNDPAKIAQDLRSAFIKSAGTFWKTAQKQVQQAVGEFNSDTESGTNTPKWMQELAVPSKSRAEEPDQTRKQPSSQQQTPSATDEAMMLESERPMPLPRQAPRSRPEHVFDSRPDSSREHSPALPSHLRESHSPQPAFMRQQQDPLASMMRTKNQQPPRSARETLSKQAAEEQASQAYTSSARRRKPASTAPPPPQERDLLEGSTSRPTKQPVSSRSAIESAPSQQQRPLKPAPPLATRPPPTARTMPPISTIALKAAHTARSQGNSHFKRGDYSTAHEAYSSSLRHIPASHPLQIVLLTNRALTALRTGQPKIAITDADTVIMLIGPSKGESETVDIPDDDGRTTAKPMREYYGKSLMRKAEALENLEKWAEAAAVWRLCVEDGHGGATAIQGRARAERAAAPKPASAPIRRPPARAATKSAPPGSISAKPAAAVKALRAQNQAAEKVDDERFALADVVAARINGWRGGKEGNLRALLASLDTVLWEGSGWKKLSMADLVLVNKVKIHYMKGIGKCHPDKISMDATTEQRMIAGAVFSTLNEAWDRFKSENGM